MRAVFFGTPEFSAKILSALVESGLDIVAVVTRQDQPQGRSKTPVQTPVKVCAQKLLPDVPIYQPAKVSTEEGREFLASFQPDFFIVAAYGEIIKSFLLEIPKIACINVHTSLLPKYRGAAPIQRCLMEGEKETGVTIMHMVKKMDAGDMIATQKVSISDEMTYGELQQKLCEIGIPLLLQALQDLATGKASKTPQEESKATLAPKVELEECELSWQLQAKQLHNLVRGVNPEPGAWAFVTVKGVKKRLKIYRTRVESLQGLPGEILIKDKTGLVVACGVDSLRLLEVQLEGKKRMSAQELLNGMSDLQF